MPTREEILGNVRSKYPQYKDVPDDQLADGLSKKYPVYADALKPTKQLDYVKAPETNETGVFPEARAPSLTRGLATAANLSPAIPAVGPGLSLLLKSLPGVRRQANTQAGAFATGGLNTISAGLSDAIASRLLGVDMDKNSSDAQFEPEARAVGDVAGAALPAGEVVGPAKSIKGLIGRSALTGGLFGFGSGISEYAKQGGDNPVEAVKEGGKAAIPSALIAGAFPLAGIAAYPLIKGVSRLTRALTPSTSTEIIQKLAKLGTGEESQIARANSGQYADLLPTLKRYKKGTGFDSYADATKAFQDNQISKVRGVVENVDPSKFGSSDFLSQTDDLLKRNIDPGELRDKALESVKPWITGVTSENILSRISQLNADLTSFYKKQSAQSPDSIWAKKAARDALSGKVKEVLAEAGVDPKAWSDYGVASEFLDSIATNRQKRIYKAGAARAENFGETIAQEGTVSPKGVISAAISNAVQRGQDIPANIDDDIERMFKRAKGTPRNYKVQPTPPVIPMKPSTDSNLLMSLRMGKEASRATAISQEELARNLRLYQRLKEIQQARQPRPGSD